MMAGAGHRVGRPTTRHTAHSSQGTNAPFAGSNVSTRRHSRIVNTDTLGDFDGSNVVGSGESPEDQLLANERRRLLEEAVARLSPQCRAVFALRVFAGHSYKEIAQQLCIAPKTVENHIARALRETHQYLRQRYQLK